MRRPAQSDRIEDQYGKELLGDIRDGKRTLMLIHLLGSASPDEKEWIVAFLARTGKRQALPDAERVLELMVQHGSLEFAF